MVPAEVAIEILKAKDAVKAMVAFSKDGRGFDLPFGYTVQKWTLEKALSDGAKLSGYKMGLTSVAKQRDVNVFDPIRGYLLEEMHLEERCPLEGRIHPRVEPEIAVIMGSELEGTDVTLAEVISAVEVVTPAAEILDSRFEAFSFKLPDVVADNTSASGYFLGKSNWKEKLDDYRLFGVNLRKNGKILHTGAPAAVLGDPMKSVQILVNTLGKEGKGLKPGHVVLTGGITTSVTLSEGDVIEMEWPGETLRFTVG